MTDLSATILKLKVDEFAAQDKHLEVLNVALDALTLTSNSEITTKLHEHISVSGFYIENMFYHGKNSCEILATDKTLPWHTRNLARQNSTFYASSIKELFPSATFTDMNIILPPKYTALNPSIVNYNNELWMIQRTVNYRIRSDGSYDMQGDDAIRTRNYLIKLDNTLSIISSEEILPPSDMPNPKYPLVIGFEDSRLFFLKGEPWCTSTVRELNDDGFCEIVLARISEAEFGQRRLCDMKIIHPKFCDKQHEKNWMPFVINDELFFFYSSDPVRIIDSTGELVHSIITDFAADNYRGGAVTTINDGWIAIIHESHDIPNVGKRRYLHRFVLYDSTGKIVYQTEAFYFNKLGIEFAAGIAIHPITNNIIVSFGFDDCESKLVTIQTDELYQKLKEIKSKPNQLLHQTKNIIAYQINKTLDSTATVNKFKDLAKICNLPLHHDSTKNWDNMIAIFQTVSFTNLNIPILDIGATTESAYLPALKQLGYNSLISINLTQQTTEIIDGISYKYGDCTNTTFNDNTFGFISCMSVIEHGVDIEMFLAESARILIPNGYLFISTDYWVDPIDTKGQYAFGVPIKIFGPDDIHNIILIAARYGLQPTTEVDLQCYDRVVNWMGLDYTFINILFKLVAK